MRTFILAVMIGAWVWSISADVPLNPRDVQPWDHLMRRLERADVETDTPSLINVAQVHPDFAVRSAAVQILGLREEKAAEDVLRKVLVTDDERLVREDAAIALVRLGDRQALEKVREFMRTEPSRQHQLRLAGQLAEFGDFSGYPLAVKAATGEDQDLRLVASGVIRRFFVAGLPDPQRLPPPQELLLTLLSDRDPEVRRRTLLEVGIAVTREGAAGSFIETIKGLSEDDPDSGVRQTARGVLLSVQRIEEGRGKKPTPENL